MIQNHSRDRASSLPADAGTHADLRSSSEPRERGVVTPDGRMEPQPPKWRCDFPVDVPEDHHVARRDFTKFMILTSLAFVVGQFWIAIRSTWRSGRGQAPIRRIAGVDDLAVGAAMPFTYPTDHDACVLVRTPAGFLAYDQKCTHLSCAVKPDVAGGRFICPCHHGYFDLATGRPLAGPPRRPLTRVTLEVRDGAVYATGLEARTT